MTVRPELKGTSQGASRQVEGQVKQAGRESEGTTAQVRREEQQAKPQPLSGIHCTGAKAEGSVP